MPRAHRISCSGYVWHLTHRCHEQQFLLRFPRDRRRWRHWLFEAKRRYGLTVLNYIATSNHVHLLCFDKGQAEIPSAMQLIAGRTAQEFNRRKNRKGAFWEDRYHATAVQTGGHLLRCMTYIDLNMVRAGAVDHPSQWEVSGYNEIQSPPRRKAIIDFAELARVMCADSIGSLRTNLKRALEDRLNHTHREPCWTTPIAVGDRNFLSRLNTMLGRPSARRRIERASGSWCLRDPAAPYGVRLMDAIVGRKSTD